MVLCHYLLEGGETGGKVDLDLDYEAVQADHGASLRVGKHSRPPLRSQWTLTMGPSSSKIVYRVLVPAQYMTTGEKLATGV